MVHRDSKSATELILFLKTRATQKANKFRLRPSCKKSGGNMSLNTESDEHNTRFPNIRVIQHPQT